MEREAGFRNRHDKNFEYPFYKDCKNKETIKKSDLCFQTSCSTILPCFVKYRYGYEEKDTLNKHINENCFFNYI
jgi:hypothetical protein